MITNKDTVIAFDVDETLIMPPNDDSGDVFFIDPYDGQTTSRSVHKRHVKLLKDHYAKNYFVIVWSANGQRWAERVVEALGIGDKVHCILAKPIKIVDDLPVTDWMGPRIYLENK